MNGWLAQVLLLPIGPPIPPILPEAIKFAGLYDRSGQINTNIEHASSYFCIASGAEVSHHPWSIAPQQKAAQRGTPCSPDPTSNFWVYQSQISWLPYPKLVVSIDCTKSPLS